MKIKVIDSHTGGEPTRLIMEGGPNLAGSGAEVSAKFEREFADLRRGILLEPRGSDIWVGALLFESSIANLGVIFFNNVGMLGMCGHGLIGVVESMRHLGWLTGDNITFETPAGVVAAALNSDRSVSFENTPSSRYKKDVSFDIPGFGQVTGDIAYGGNWFFIAKSPKGTPIDYSLTGKLGSEAFLIRRALEMFEIRGANGAVIDHIELTMDLENSEAHARNFVLCPGAAYDRSPCGTGTSAKLACLAEDGWPEGKMWIQESITGSRFYAKYRRGENNTIIPEITGRAWVTGINVLNFEEDDPLKNGMG